jgi:hypothetical protein
MERPSSKRERPTTPARKKAAGDASAAQNGGNGRGRGIDIAGLEGALLREATGGAAREEEKHANHASKATPTRRGSGGGAPPAPVAPVGWHAARGFMVRTLRALFRRAEAAPGRGALAALGAGTVAAYLQYADQRGLTPLLADLAAGRDGAVPSPTAAGRLLSSGLEFLAGRVGALQPALRALYKAAASSTAEKHAPRKSAPAAVPPPPLVHQASERRPRPPPSSLPAAGSSGVGVARPPTPKLQTAARLVLLAVILGATWWALRQGHGSLDAVRAGLRDARAWLYARLFGPPALRGEVSTAHQELEPILYELSQGLESLRSTLSQGDINEYRRQLQFYEREARKAVEAESRNDKRAAKQGLRGMQHGALGILRSISRISAEAPTPFTLFAHTSYPGQQLCDDARAEIEHMRGYIRLLSFTCPKMDSQVVRRFDTLAQSVVDECASTRKDIDRVAHHRLEGLMELVRQAETAAQRRCIRPGAFRGFRMLVRGTAALGDQQALPRAV